MAVVLATQPPTKRVRQQATLPAQAGHCATNRQRDDEGRPDREPRDAARRGTLPYSGCVDDALREAERRGDDERLAALRRRAGLPPPGVEPLLPDLRTRLQELVEAEAEYSLAGADNALIAAMKLRKALDDLGPQLLDGLEWIATTEFSRGDPRRAEALRSLVESRHLDQTRHERLARSPDHEIHTLALAHAGQSRPPPAWAGRAGRAALKGCGEDVAGHLRLLAEVDAAGSVAVFDRHQESGDLEASVAAFLGLLAAGPRAFGPLARTACSRNDAMVWDRLFELDRERAWGLVEAATGQRSVGFHPWRWLVKVDLSRALTLAAARVEGSWPEGNDSDALGPRQAALDALVNCGDPRAEAVLLRERAQPGPRGAWAAGRHQAWTQIRTGAWRGDWED